MPGAFAGLTARRRQLGLPVGEIFAPLQVWETTFLGGPEDGLVHRLIDAPEQWAVYRHRQAVGISEVRHVHATRMQESLWERHLYVRVWVAPGAATYRPAGI